MKWMMQYEIITRRDDRRSSSPQFHNYHQEEVFLLFLLLLFWYIIRDINIIIIIIKNEQSIDCVQIDEKIERWIYNERSFSLLPLIMLRQCSFGALQIQWNLTRIIANQGPAGYIWCAGQRWEQIIRAKTSFFPIWNQATSCNFLVEPITLVEGSSQKLAIMIITAMV